MTWNYRLIHRQGVAGASYAIHEVYYDDAGCVDGFTMDPVGVAGDTPEEARSAYAQMAEAFEMPVLEYEDILA